MDAFLQCVIDLVDPQSCAFPPQCQPALMVYLGCRGLDDLVPMCEGSSDACHCEMLSVDMFTFESWCQKMGSLTNCACAFNGQLVGSCSYQGPLECAPFLNCCATLLNVPGFP